MFGAMVREHVQGRGRVNNADRWDARRCAVACRSDVGPTSNIDEQHDWVTGALRSGSWDADRSALRIGRCRGGVVMTPTRCPQNTLAGISRQTRPRLCQAAIT